VDDAGFCIFDTPENGIRALAKVLRTYQMKHGLCEVETIIDRWAPPEENNTKAYVSAVCKRLGVQPDDWISLMEEPQMLGMVTAIIQHENGSQPYGHDVLARGVRGALA
jgi:hypothetical protein